MPIEIAISIVVPTCNRKISLLRLLNSLNESIYPVHEVIIVDSGTERLDNDELLFFNKLQIQYLQSERSVCIQRNMGIRNASAPWIFLCDDDLEVPAEYLSHLAHHVAKHVHAGAVSGLVLQKENEKWMEQYPVTSSIRLLWQFVFQLSIWGEIKCSHNNNLIERIKRYYTLKGNHISKAGWPVLTDFSGDYFKTPVYGLGASLIKKEWLLQSPYDEVLDANGIGDNYGVSIGFPKEGIHVLKNAFVYHHQEQINRPLDSARYFKRILALDYFIRTRPELSNIHSGWFVWSLIGNLISVVFTGKRSMVMIALKSIVVVALGNNPYTSAAKTKFKITEPTL